ncbi:hypothetical protein [Streptomyces beijiangensis]|uniref:Uncharacterized protein n=1 Tax=Streptomyces beijiangensis TaxID=163361 RepID=A0A939F232_9ACTN|nr:hypothetical protein [Streptomyces beijiangensis]MBO0510790.1 hypothetical protein [Streptomyces beijiangensis]
METAQRVIHRSGLFSRLLLVLVGLALLLLSYTLLRENLPQRLLRTWPWKLKLLDIQSAVAGVLATGGATLARAQYARTIRPALGFFGRVIADVAPGVQLAWVSHFYNGGQGVAVTEDLSYWIDYTSSARADGATNSSAWVTHQVATASIESRGLLNREDFALHVVGRGRPIPGQQLQLLSWFAEKAMREVESVFVRLRVVDQVGDTHERVINVLKAADRSPTRTDPPPF